MTTTANFQITHLSDSQTQKEAAINAAWDRIDQRMTGVLTHDMASDADYTLVTTDPAYEHQNYLIRITDTGALLSTARTVQFPATKGPYVLHNQTGQTINARVGGAGGFVACGAGTINGIFNDGTDMILRAGAGGTPVTAVPYDFTMFFGGIPTPTASSELLRIPFTRAVTFPIGLSGSEGSASTAATAASTFTFRKNGSSFASATFAMGAATANFTCLSLTSFAAGDIFTCDAPMMADLSLANVGLSLAATRL